jgi:hypothetical protein
MPSFGLHLMMALPPSVSTAALCTCILSAPPFYPLLFFLSCYRESVIASGRLIAVSGFQQSTPEVMSGFCFLNYRSGLGGVWGPLVIHEADASVMSE